MIIRCKSSWGPCFLDAYSLRQYLTFFVLMIVLVHMLCAVYFRNTIFLIKNDGLASYGLLRNSMACVAQRFSMFLD